MSSLYLYLPSISGTSFGHDERYSTSGGTPRAELLLAAWAENQAGGSQ